MINKGTRQIRQGFLLIAVGIVLAAIHVGTQAKGLDDLGFFATMVGLVLVIVGSHRRSVAKRVPTL